MLAHVLETLDGPALSSTVAAKHTGTISFLQSERTHVDPWVFVQQGIGQLMWERYGSARTSSELGVAATDIACAPSAISWAARLAEADIWLRCPDIWVE